MGGFAGALGEPTLNFWRYYEPFHRSEGAEKSPLLKYLMTTHWKHCVCLRALYLFISFYFVWLRAHGHRSSLHVLPAFCPVYWRRGRSPHTENCCLVCRSTLSCKREIQKKEKLVKRRHMCDPYNHNLFIYNRLP